MTLKNKNHHGKGNVKRQKQRRKQRRKQLPPRWSEAVLLIDGNYSFYPVAYCYRYEAFLTQGLLDTHRCHKRKCPRFRKVDHEED